MGGGLLWLWSGEQVAGLAEVAVEQLGDRAPGGRVRQVVERVVEDGDQQADQEPGPGLTEAASLPAQDVVDELLHDQLEALVGRDQQARGLVEGTAAQGD